MEKLIELLNESTNGRFKSEDDLRLCIEMRGYCRKFIKRLVENNKIDYSKVDTQNWNNLQEELDCRLSDKLIMLLSIQDNPIDFLISILKDKKVRTVYVDKDGNVSGDTKRYTDC